MSPLVWIVVPPLVAIVPVYLLRRWLAVSIGLAVAACLTVAVVVLRVPGEAALQISGRDLALSPTARLAIPALAILNAGLIAVGGIRGHVSSFRVAALFGLAVISLALLVRATAITIVLGELGALSLIWPILEARMSARDALGYAVIVAIAMPCYLLAIWLLDAVAANPGQPAFLEIGVALLALGFGLLLALIPFHGWWLIIAEAVSPPVAALVSVAFPLGALAVLADVVAANPILATVPLARELALGGGLLSVVGGALLAAMAGGTPADRPRRLMAAAAIHDLGAVFVGIGLGHQLATAGAVLDLAGRTLAMLLMAAALEGLQCARAGQGGRWATQVGTAGAVFAGLSLAGMPLTGGFPGRWLIALTAFGVNPYFGFVLLLSGGVVALSFLDLLRQEIPFLPGHGRPSAVTAGIILLVLLSIGLSLWPQWILGQAVGGLALLAGG